MKSLASALSFILLSCLSISASQAQNEAEHLVLTSLAPVHQLALSLTVNSTIEVSNIPNRARSMASQPTFFTRQGERFTEQFMRAEAVITTGKLWAMDPFYTTAREFNIRIVNIDASKPWSHELSGVAVSTSPVDGSVSPYFWTSPSNTIRMLDIIARDLQKLFPDQAEIIARNLIAEKNYFQQLKANFEIRFIEVFDPLIYSLADEFTYLTSDLGIFVEDYFVKQDIDWSESDFSTLSEELSAANVKVVIHKWEPSEQIQQAVSEANAKLIVLDTMETTVDYKAAMTSNLELLLQSFAE